MVGDNNKLGLDYASGDLGSVGILMNREEKQVPVYDDLEAQLANLRAI